MRGGLGRHRRFGGHGARPRREFDRGLALLGILAALSWIVQAACSYRGKKPHAAIYFLPVICWGVRLVRDFRVWSRDPVILDYCYSLLALIFALCAMLELGGFAFDRGKRRLTAFFTLGGIFFAAAAMAGAQPRDVAITGGALLYLLTQSWPLLRPVQQAPREGELAAEGCLRGCQPAVTGSSDPLRPLTCDTAPWAPGEAWALSLQLYKKAPQVDQTCGVFYKREGGK